MPDPFDRHSRPNGCCESWDSQPPRSQLRRMAAEEDGAGFQAADAPLITARKAPGKKNRDMCKGTHWKSGHQPEFRVRQLGWSSERECKWGISWAAPGEPYWTCWHEEACTGCGRILRHSIPAAECPDLRPITEAERSVIMAEIKRRGERTTARQSRRAVITGPQGYRRKRSA